MEFFRDGIDTNTHKARLAFLAFQDMVFFPAVVKICQVLKNYLELDTYIYEHTCACVRARARTHTHTHTHTHLYTQSV